MERRGLTSSNGGRPILTAAMFLGKGESPAYVTPHQILQFVDKGRLEDVKELEGFFDMVKERLKIIVPRNPRTDKSAVPYKYTTFIRPNSPDGAKVVLIGNINQFMDDYRDGKFSIDFTFEELVAEAEKA